MHPSSKTSRGHPRLHETKQRSPCRSRIRAMAYCRFPSFCKGPVVFSWLKQTATMVRCWEPSWPWTPYSSNDWPKRSLFTPPHPPLSTLPSGSCFVGVSSLTCPLHSRCTPQPRIPSQQPFHPIYAPETVWSGKRETPPPPQASGPPDSRGGQVNATPVVEDHKDVQKEPNPKVDCQHWGSSTNFTR